jgi:hypothetical protein
VKSQTGAKTKIDAQRRERSLAFQTLFILAFYWYENILIESRKGSQWKHWIEIATSRLVVIYYNYVDGALSTYWQYTGALGSPHALS